MYFIVQSGLTRRLVEADDVDWAMDEFLKARLVWRHIQDVDDAVEIWPASEQEIAEFQRTRRTLIDGQAQLELDDIRAGYGETEHA